MAMHYLVSIALIIVNVFTILNILLISKYLFGGDIRINNRILMTTGGIFLVLDLILSLTLDDSHANLITLIIYAYILGVLLMLTKSHRLKTLFLTIPVILVYVQWCAILELIEKLFGLDHFYYHYMAGYDVTLAHVFADPLLFLLLCRLGKYSKKHAFNTQLTIGEGVIITILCIFLPIIQEVFNLLEEHFQNILYNIAWTLFIIALNFAVIYTIAHRKKAQYYKELSENYKEQFSSEYHYFKDYKTEQTDLAKFRHDFNSHIILLQEMMTNGEYERAHHYFSDLTAGFSHGNTSSVSPPTITGNEIIDLVLSARNDLLSRETIQVYCEEPLTELNFMNEVDCCILFSNLIDNALEANMKLETKRYIRFSKKKTANNLFIEISNPIKEKAVMEGDQYISQKQGSNHGIGLQNIIGIINKYKGSYHISEENNVFSVQILFPLPFVG